MISFIVWSCSISHLILFYVVSVINSVLTCNLNSYEKQKYFCFKRGCFYGNNTLPNIVWFIQGIAKININLAIKTTTLHNTLLTTGHLHSLFHDWVSCFLFLSLEWPFPFIFTSIFIFNFTMEFLLIHV